MIKPFLYPILFKTLTHRIFTIWKTVWNCRVSIPYDPLFTIPVCYAFNTISVVYSYFLVFYPKWGYLSLHFAHIYANTPQYKSFPIVCFYNNFFIREPIKRLSKPLFRCFLLDNEKYTLVLFSWIGDHIEQNCVSVLIQMITN